MRGEGNRAPVWQTPDRISEGRLPMRAHYRSGPDLDAARAGTPWRLSLDGAWHFRLFAAPEAVPVAVLETGYDDHDWRSIEVPGCWPSSWCAIAMRAG